MGGVSPAEESSAFVLGLDGVPWNLIEGWVDDGELPAFARLFEEGATGPLQSTTPASTPLAWPSIATGRRPDGHGVYWFRQLQRDYSHRVATSADVKGARAWDLVTPASVANVPMTYPAREIDGNLVTGMMTPGKDDDGFTHPPELADAVDREVPDYEVGLDWGSFDGDPSEFVEEIDGLVDARERLMEYLLEETTFRLGFVVFTAPDRLQHLVWDEEVLLDHYRRLDDVLARVQEYVDERDSTLFVVSDHGFGPIERVVSPNRIMEEAGYLSRRSDEGTRGMLSRLGVTKDTVHSWLDRIGVDDETVVETLPQGLVDMVAMQVPGDNAVYDIDYSGSKAFVRGDGSLYINRTDRFDDGVVDPADADALKAELTELFERFTDPETGEKVLEVVDGDDIFPEDDESPDLVIETEGVYRTHTPLTDEAIFDTQDMAASHYPEGIMLTYGPDVDAGGHIRDANVVDVLPTLLHALGEPVPSDVHGEVLRSVFEPGSDPHERDVTYGDATADDGPSAAADGDGETAESVEDRLRGLGYID